MNDGETSSEFRYSEKIEAVEKVKWSLELQIE